jgi:hypothetical protein
VAASCIMLSATFHASSADTELLIEESSSSITIVESFCESHSREFHSFEFNVSLNSTAICLHESWKTQSDDSGEFIDATSSNKRNLLINMCLHFQQFD